MWQPWELLYTCYFTLLIMTKNNTNLVQEIQHKNNTRISKEWNQITLTNTTYGKNWHLLQNDTSESQLNGYCYTDISLSNFKQKNDRPPLRSILCTLGCHTTSPTRRWCATKSTTGSSRFLNSPPSGICQILIVQSSEPLAMTSSSWGHHWMSRMAARWPTTSGLSRSTRPVWITITNRVITLRFNRHHWVNLV